MSLTFDQVRAYCLDKGVDPTPSQVDLTDRGKGAAIENWTVPGVAKPTDAQLAPYTVAAAKSKINAYNKGLYSLVDANLKLTDPKFRLVQLAWRGLGAHLGVSTEDLDGIQTAAWSTFCDEQYPTA